MTQFDLEQRTRKFAFDVRKFVKVLPKTIGAREDSTQLIRSSGSIGANYIEANEGFSKKDFIFRITISRKESKESIHWLELLRLETPECAEGMRQYLLQEVKELMCILSAIYRKSL